MLVTTIRITNTAFRRRRYGRMRQAGCGGLDATTTDHDGGGDVFGARQNKGRI